MTLIIYGNKKSENCSKVDYVARYLKLDFEYKELDFEKDLKTQDYLKIHPAGKVPAVDDEGFVVFESNTICRYLCEKVKSDLYPEDLKRRTLVNQWMDFTSTQVSEALGRIFFGKDEAVKAVQEHVRSFQEGLQKLHLTSQPLTDLAQGMTELSKAFA